MTINELKTKYSNEITQTRKRLGCDFDTPAQRTINGFFETTGIQRLRKAPGGYIDTWDLLTSDDPTDIQVIPKKIAERWMTY